MCTVTMQCGAGSLLLTMNRDERFERAPEEPPRRIPGDSSRPAWLAPFDSASGGTWMGINERGVASCVLNGYEPSDEGLGDDPAVPSRGSIIPRILEEQDGIGPARLPDMLDFSAYPSFTLLVTSKDGGETVRWRRGAGLTREVVLPGWTFLTSSSWNEPEVALWRRRAFEAWLASGEPEVHGLPTLHLVATAGDEPNAPFMTRETSATRSITQVRIVGKSPVASLIWWPRRGTAVIDPAHPGASTRLKLTPAAALVGGDRQA
jgi:hypothetical protein